MSESASPAVGRLRDEFERVRPALRGSAARRSAALARFVELGFPGAREEAWKYTNLRRLESRKFVAAADAAGATATTHVPALGQHRLTLVNGAITSTPPGSLAGFHVSTLDAAESTSADDLLRVLPGLGTERFSALNAALTTGPLRLAMPEGARSEETLQLDLLTSGASTLASPRIVVRMAARSAGRLLLVHADDGAGEQFTNAVLDVELGAGAELVVYRLQVQGDKAFHIERIDARLADGARFVLRDAQLGGTLARADVQVSLDGRDASAELTGVFLADGSRHLDTHALVHHRGVGTQSLQDFRGVAANRGRAVFNGKAIVHPDAQKSNARQVNRNLLLTPGAEIDTKPDLEIYADDVQCSHGATTGQLDPNALFYLRSRGLDEAEARSALTRAFAGAVLSRVELPALAEHVHAVLDDRLVRLLEVTP